MGFFDTMKEEKVSVEGVDDIYKYTERLKEVVTKYDVKANSQKETAA